MTISNALCMDQRPIDGYYWAARHELDRYLAKRRRDNPRFDLSPEDTQRFVDNVEFSMRFRDFREAVEPYERQKAWLFTLYATPKFVVGDGSLQQIEAELPAECTQMLGLLDQIIASVAKQHGITL